jgi:hypothetical protein
MMQQIGYVGLGIVLAAGSVVLGYQWGFQRGYRRGVLDEVREWYPTVQRLRLHLDTLRDERESLKGKTHVQ